MIDINEIISNIDNLRIIDPFSFKYITLNLKDPYTLKFKLNSKFYYPSNHIKYYKESYYTITIVKYMKILRKIFNESISTCYKCKKNILYKYCCNLCHEWFCPSCCESHNQVTPEHEKNLKDIYIDVIYNNNYFEKDNEIEVLEKKLFKIKFLSEKDIQKNWEICECHGGGGLVIGYCNHGLKCKNCFFETNRVCNCCELSPKKELRFFYLDILFLKTELNNYDELIMLKDDINGFNRYIAKLYIDNINYIKDNKSREKRFKKHFYNLRNNFIEYQKLKLIVINQMRKDQNYHLVQLFKKMKYFKLCFKEYKYYDLLTKDENISRISNFFASQNPIYFFDYLGERRNRNISQEPQIIENYEENINNNKTRDKEEKKYPLGCYEFDIHFSQYNYYYEIREYIKLINLFEFEIVRYYNFENEKKSYFIKFKDEDLNNKIEIFANKNRYCIYCKPIIKLSDLKWIFQFNPERYFYDSEKPNIWTCVVNLVDEIDNIFEIEYYIKCEGLNKILELEKLKKYLFYRKGGNDNNKIILFNSNYPYSSNQIDLYNKEIEKIFKLDNYKNIAFIFLSRPLLNLIILDYKFEQINTIIDLIRPNIPSIELLQFRPYIFEIKELDNKKIIFYGRQKKRYFINNKTINDIIKYDFKLLFNYEDLQIEIAENTDYYDDCAWE